ncbi:hypothetical protein [Streptomyces sp. NPDC127033]
MRCGAIGKDAMPRLFGALPDPEVGQVRVLDDATERLVARLRLQ